MNLPKKASLLFAAALMIGSVRAADFDFSGHFTFDNDIARFGFSVAAPSTVTVFSSSWIAGGFDPILAIWTSTGSLMYQQDDGHNIGSTMSNGVWYNHGTWDSFYAVNLSAGNYIATVGEYDNFANGTLLSQGFRRDNNPKFTFDLGFGGATQPLFNGVWSNHDPRTSAYAFHLLNVETATHEPPHGVPDASATGLLVAIGLAGLALAKRRAQA